MSFFPGARRRLEDWFAGVVDWPEAVLPDYDGGSIANLAGTVLHALNGPAGDDAVLPPLRPDLLHPAFFHGTSTIVLLVVDGLGVGNLDWAMSHGAVEWLDTADSATVITSVFPSTTAAALTTIQTGLSPAQHGIAGYTVFLSDQQATVSMITWKPTGGMQLHAPLPEPKDFLEVPNIYERLAARGVESVIVSNSAFSDSPLTNVQSAGVPYAGHRTLAELSGLLLEEATKPGRRFVYGYCDGFDTLAHTHGPESDICLNEIYLLDQALGRGFFQPLADERPGDVAVILVADHGHASIDRERMYSLKDVLAGRSAGRPIPTGDRRATGLPFDDPAGLQALRDLAGDSGVLLPVDQAVANGLYGPGEAHPDLRSRVGKTLLLARDDTAFVYPQSSNPTAGGHGSLTSGEMLVPLLAWRF